MGASWSRPCRDNDDSKTGRKRREQEWWRGSLWSVAFQEKSSPFFSILRFTVLRKEFKRRERAHRPVPSPSLPNGFFLIECFLHLGG